MLSIGSLPYNTSHAITKPSPAYSKALAIEHLDIAAGNMSVESILLMDMCEGESAYDRHDAEVHEKHTPRLALTSTVNPRTHLCPLRLCMIMIHSCILLPASAQLCCLRGTQGGGTLSSDCRIVRFEHNEQPYSRS